MRSLQGVVLINLDVKQSELITQLRENRGMSQRQLANAAKISQVTVSRGESGHTEFQSSTAVRVLRSMAAQSPFSAEELAEIQGAFGISSGVFSRTIAPSTRSENGSDQTPAALAAALAGIVGQHRAIEILRDVLAGEASQFHADRDVRAVKFSQTEKGSDGKTYQVTQIVPTVSATPKGTRGKRKAT